MGSEFLDVYFADEEMERIFTGQSMLQKWAYVEAALARAQAAVGFIPQDKADEITRASQLTVDVKWTQDATIKNGGAMIVALAGDLKRKCRGDAGQYVHWGATSQDISDTGLALQLKEALPLVLRKLLKLERATVDLTREHRTTLMAGRTHGQHGLPTTFGYVTSVWAREIHRHIIRIEQMRPRLLIGNLAGGVGTLASYGPRAHEMQRIALEDLGLGVPDVAWHTARDHLAELACVMSLMCATMAKICHEIANLMRTEIGEVEEPFFDGKIGSSTMPQKRNPMMAESVVALEKLVRSKVSTAIEAMIVEHNRDLGTWVTEFHSIPDLFKLVGRVLTLTTIVVEGLIVKPERMRKNLEISQGYILTEAVMFKLAKSIGRQEAHGVVYRAAMDAIPRGLTLQEALRSNPELAKHLTPVEIESALDPAGYIDSAAKCADRVIEMAEEGWTRWRA